MDNIVNIDEYKKLKESLSGSKDTLNKFNDYMSDISFYNRVMKEEMMKKPNDEMLKDIYEGFKNQLVLNYTDLLRYIIEHSKDKRVIDYALEDLDFLVSTLPIKEMKEIEEKDKNL